MGADVGVDVGIDVVVGVNVGVVRVAVDLSVDRISVLVSVDSEDEVEVEWVWMGGKVISPPVGAMASVAVITPCVGLIAPLKALQIMYAP